MDLTKTFSDDQYSRALQSWTWLRFDGLAPRFSSLFGDTFFVAADGAWWLLEHLYGELTRYWADSAALAADLATEEGEDHYLLGAFAMAADGRGIELADDQVYVFIPHPMISRDFGVDRIQAMNFVAAMSVTGQTHAHVRGD